MEEIDTIWTKIGKGISSFWHLFNEPIISLGGSNISIITIIYMLLFFGGLLALTSWLKRRIINRIVNSTHLDKGAAVTIGTITRVILNFMGIIILIQSVGIDLSALNLLAGALGVGIGFGFQSTANNYISGIIILFEKPIKLDDRIEVNGIEGNITNISARATTILTNNNISLIIPNSDITTKCLINSSYNDQNIRIEVPVGVSYKEDPKKIEALLLQVCDNSPNVLKTPKPILAFDNYGDSALNFNLLVWTSNHINKPKMLKSELYYSIFEQFKLHKIEIPYPQRDIHIKSTSEN